MLLRLGLHQQLIAQDLKKGEDLVEAPAIASGFCVHNLFQSNMVIQRDKPIKIWGWAKPGEKVTVTLGTNQVSDVTDEKRKWMVTLPERPASSKPLQIVIQGADKKIELKNVLVGDVWLLGGQSNMAHPICRVEDGDLEIASANYPNIRILQVPLQDGPKAKRSFPRLYQWSGFFKMHYRRGYWDVCTPENVRELSGIGYVFARRIHTASQIPIGVINVSRGGTCLETWTPMEVLNATQSSEVETKLSEWDKKISQYDPKTARADPALDMNRPGNCYASMLTPIAGLSVKGAIWHQGYNNAVESGYVEGHVMYYQLFGKMIESWRRAFEDPQMPFGIISLCTDGPFQTLDNYLEMMVNEGQFIRDVQYKTYLDYRSAGDNQVGFVSSYDMRRDWYHPQLKRPVGERIARWALATQYGKSIPWQPPMITEMRVLEDKLELSFNAPVDAGRGKPIEGFAIAGEDRMFQPATAENLELRKDKNNRPVYDYNKVILSSPHVAKPIHYRYAWGRNPMGNLKFRYKFDSSILPTQRSDDWRIHEVPYSFGDKADRRTLNQIRRVNRSLDMQRRIKDAQKLIEGNKESNDQEIDSILKRN